LLGDRLKDLRSSINKTQEMVAADLEISRANYSHLENNRNQPDSETLLKLAGYYKVSTDYLLGNDNVNKSDPTEDIALDDGLDGHKPMTYRGKEIPDADKEILRRILKGLD
jgi:transcriptional regulator with XRE-family HTH domain